MKKIKYKKVSIRAKLATGLLYTAYAKKPFVSEVNASKYLEGRLIKNDEKIELPKLHSIVEEESFKNFQIFNIGENNKRVILYLHGGAYNCQPSIFHYRFADFLYQKTGIKVIFPIYPKAPKYNYKDCYEMLDYIYNNIIDEGYDEIIFMGDSAGGGLALSYYQYLKKNHLRTANRLVLISPWLDLSMTNPQIINYEDRDPMISREGLKYMGKIWADNEDLKQYMLSPIYGDLTYLPKTLIFTGTDEILYPDIKLLMKKLKNNKKVTYYKYQKMNHVFVLFPIPEGKIARNQIVDFLNN